MTEVSLVSQRLKLQLILTPSRSGVYQTWEKKTVCSLFSLFSKSTLLNPETFLILFQVNENKWNISIHNSGTVTKELCIPFVSFLSLQDTLSSITGWIQSENFRRQCLTQNVQSGLPGLLTDSKAC